MVFLNSLCLAMEHYRQPHFLTLFLGMLRSIEKKTEPRKYLINQDLISNSRNKYLAVYLFVATVNIQQKSFIFFRSSK